LTCISCGSAMKLAVRAARMTWRAGNLLGVAAGIPGNWGHCAVLGRGGDAGGAGPSDQPGSGLPQEIQAVHVDPYPTLRCGEVLTGPAAGLRPGPRKDREGPS